MGYLTEKKTWFIRPSEYVIFDAGNMGYSTLLTQSLL